MSIFAHTSTFSGVGAFDASATRSRVIIATIERPQGDTGIHAHTHALLEGLKRAGIETELTNPFTAGPKWLPMFAVRKVLIKPVNKTWSLRWYRHWHYAALRESLTRALLRRPADAVIAQCPVSARAALEVRRRLRINFKIAMVCHFNYSEATEYRDKGELRSQRTFDRMMKLEALVLKSVDEVIYVSNWAQRVVESERAITTKRSRVIWNGIATSADDQLLTDQLLPDQLLTDRSLTRGDIGISGDDLMLINVGSLEPRKNQIQLLDLFQQVHGEHPAVKLVLVGDGAQRAQIEDKIRALNLTGSVVMLGHRTDVPSLLKLADLYVHYSKLENCPVILLEAARAGLPIAGIPAGGVGEVGQQLGTLIQLNECDLQQSLDSLRPVLADAALRRELGTQARQGFERSFTREAMVKQYMQALSLRAGVA